MRSSSVSFLGFLAFAIAAACGGASNTDLLGGGGSHASGSSSGSSSGSGSGSGSGGGSGSSSGSTSSSGSGSGSSSGGMPDASMEDVTSVDVIQPMETGPGAAVLCPMSGQPAMCNPGDVCCVTGDPTLGTQMDNCQHAGQPCTGGTIVRCASAADCNKGQVCCGQKDTTGMMYTEVACRQTCTGTGQVTFCNPQAATSDCTQPAAPNCVQSTLLQGYNVCGP